MSTKIARDEMMTALNISDKPLPNKYIKCLYNEFVIKTNKNKIQKTNKVRNIVDTTTDKYKVLLEFVNKILINIGKDPITNLTQFKNIDREDIILPKNKPILENMAPKLFKHFNKKKSGYYRKSDNWMLNVLRGLVREIGLKYSKSIKNIYINENNRAYVKTHTFYSIKNI